jgi:hypothetical protein
MLRVKEQKFFAAFFNSGPPNPALPGISLPGLAEQYPAIMCYFVAVRLTKSAA